MSLQQRTMTKNTPSVGSPPDDYLFFINLDERGEFYADVRDSNDNTVYEIHGTDLVEDGYIQDKADLNGLLHYLIQTCILPPSSSLKMGQ